MRTECCIVLFSSSSSFRGSPPFRFPFSEQSHCSCDDEDRWACLECCIEVTLAGDSSVVFRMCRRGLGGRRGSDGRLRFRERLRRFGERIGAACPLNRRVARCHHEWSECTIGLQLGAIEAVPVKISVIILSEFLRRKKRGVGKKRGTHIPRMAVRFESLGSVGSWLRVTWSHSSCASKPRLSGSAVSRLSSRVRSKSDFNDPIVLGSDDSLLCCSCLRRK